MARKKTSRDPFEVRLSETQRAELEDFLTREIDYAIMARMSVVGDDGLLDDAHLKYLGGDGTLTKDTPWPGAANLGSPIVTEHVDAMRARIMATVFTDPLWIVEGFGKAAERAWQVEEFHQWKADQTKLQPAIGRAVHNSLIEGTGILEVSDRVVMRKGLKQIKSKVKTDPATGHLLLGANGQAQADPHPDTGKFQEEDDPQKPSLNMVVEDLVRATDGPTYRVNSLKDFYMLPGSATEREDIWGYAKRLFRRLADLKSREKDGYYQNVDALGGPASSERMSGTGGVSDISALARQGQDIAPQDSETTAEKEIWELTLLLDLDDDGYEEWYVITWSQLYRTILRVQYQNYDTPTYIILTPFPRPNSVYGFSYAKDKLGTLYDEHASLRNMFMDRCNLKGNQPLMQTDGGLWNPALKPWGPGRVINVRDMNELKEFTVSDVPQSVPLMMKEVLSSAERISGMNDTTTGQTSGGNTTATEVKLVTQQSWIRIDEVVKNLQQAFEDLFQVLNTIWVAKLRETPEPWPGDMIVSMQQRAINMPPMITADVLDGPFRGKPRGSVEGSDLSQMRVDFVQFLTALNQFGQTVPAVKQLLNNPTVVRSIMTQAARVYRWPDRANLLGGFSGASTPPMPMPPKPQDPPKININIKADAASDPLAQEIMAATATKEGVAGTGQGMMPPTPPVSTPGISNATSPITPR